MNTGIPCAAAMQIFKNYHIL